MKKIIIYILTAAALMLSYDLHAVSPDGDSPAVQMLDSQKDSKRLDGTKLKIARPFLKRTPMGVIIDEIDMMILCPLDDNKENSEILAQAGKILKRYILIREIDDERSKMAIYIDPPQGDNFSEIIICNFRPENSIMLFSGNFTVESLIKVGEVSEQQRKHLKKNN